MRLFVALLFLVSLAAPTAAADRSDKPPYHDEMSKLWDQLGREFEDFSNKFREHFGGKFPFAREGQSRGDRGERPIISNMLNHREELKLSPEQVQKLEDVRNEFERNTRNKDDELRRAERELDELQKSDSIDLKQAEAKVREVERLHADQRLARLRAVEQGKSILTQEQRDRLRDLQSGGSRLSRKQDSQRGEKRPKADRGNAKPEGESF
jgi:Spy/CpxP family protein refolding chaperone